MKLFAKKRIMTQHSVLDYKIYLYLPEPKLAIEGVDGKGHTDRDTKVRSNR